MNNIIEFSKGLYGVKAIIKSKWQDSFLDILSDNNINEIELNDGKGWHGENLDFLRAFPLLKSLTIIDLKIKSIDPIHYLNALTSINLSTYSKFPVNFKYFPNLTNCGFEWIKNSDSLFECKNLVTLSINKYDKLNTDAFAQLINLEKLTLLNSPVENIKGISLLFRLKYLSIANLNKLTSLEGIEHLQQMKELEIQRCKRIHTISEIFKLKELEKFFLLDCGDIESIRGIENLKKIKSFLFYESTNIMDGDLSSIFNLKNLSNISYQNRKHYTHKREDFGQLFKQTGANL